MSYRKSFLILLMIAMMALWGCSDDDDDPVTPPSGDTSFETMAAAGAAYINDSASCPGILSAESVHDNLDDYTVIDIRQEVHYLAGHIPGAYNSSLGTLLDDVANTIPSDKPYVIACYSGQSAGHAKIAMELMGYNDVYSLLFGMSSWNNSLDFWTNNCADNLPAGMIETENQNGNLTVHDFPELDESNSEVVAARVEAILAAGFKGKSFAGDDGIMDNLDDYFVINYFGEADYEGTGTSGVPGHIEGAFQFTPYSSLGIEQMLENVPSDMPVIVYCWTGQHSSQITAYLNMLGYEAYSLKYGSNNLFYSELTAHKWNVDTASHDYELEVGPMADETFQAIADALAAYVNDSAQCPGVLSAEAVHDNLEDYTIIDIRSAEHFTNLGHIEGAYNSSLATLLDDLDGTIPSDKPYVIACYTGQSAGHAKIAMELMGYDDVYSMTFGMSAWNSSLDSWTGNCADNLPVGMNETENQNGNLEVYGYPVIPEGTTVADRVNDMLDAGFKGKSFAGDSGIMDNLDEYFVINYFGVDDYEGNGMAGVPGHIEGAFQYTPYMSMGIGQMLANIPTDMPVVVYCWTGQHSSQITAYLNMLGYEAYSLKFGSNNLFHSVLTAHKWTAAGQGHDYDLTAPPPVVQ